MAHRIRGFYTLRRFIPLFVALVLLQVGIVPTSAASPYFRWVPWARGADYAWIPYTTTASKAAAGNIFVVRIARDAATFKIYYEPGQRQTVANWAANMPGAAMIVNASFFDSAGRPFGIVKLGDATFGVATGDPIAGVFRSVNGVPQVVPGTNPGTTTVNSRYSESFESHPILIAGKHIIFFEGDGSARERRTVIAQDTAGYIQIIYTSSLELSLSELASWLQTSGLNIVTALNLDGGASSQLHFAVPGDFSKLVQGTTRVPVVLAVFLR